jgi:hypothetical protein
MVTLLEDQYTFSIISQFYLELKMLQTKFVEKLKTHFAFINPPPENRAVYEIMWKNKYRAGQATYDNMAHAHCLLDT